MSAGEKLAAVSLILPIRNESAYIERCLKAILAQDYPHHLLEVILVDGNSTDDTREKIARFTRNFPDLRLLVMDNPDQFMPIGFNRGLRQARGGIIVMLGDHVEIAPDYVTQCVRVLNEATTVCVGGAMETMAGGWVGQAIALAMSSAFGVGGVAFRALPDRQMEVDTSVFAIYCRQVFDQIGALTGGETC
jgi:glycosyltransferase involved in cell wall biosynthesis